MKKFLGILLLLLGGVTFGTLHMPAVTKLRTYPTGTLEQEAKAMQLTIDAANLPGLSDQQYKKSDLLREKFYYQIELARRSYGLEWLSIIAAIFGMGLIALSVLNKKEGSRRISKVRVTEAMPTELYVDEQEFYRRTQDSFPSKDDALMWFENDPMRTCTYCGSHSVKPIRGMMDEIQLTTFYKKVPGSAKDLRIVLGSMWFIKPAQEMQCENCQHKVQR